MANPVAAGEIDPVAVDWLWGERIPRGMMTIVGGRPDQGKGLFCTYLAAEISNMKLRDPHSGKARKGRVLYSAVEDSHSQMTRPRLEAASADLDQVDLWRFQLPAQMSELEMILLSGNYDLLVMDPLAAHLSHGVSRHSDNIRTVLTPLTELIEATQTAVVIVEHVLKRVPQNSDAIASIGGSGSGIVAASRMGFLFGVDPGDDDRRLLCCIKNNLRERPMAISFEIDALEVDVVGEVPYLLQAEEVEFDPIRMLSPQRFGGKVGRPPDKRANAAEWLTTYLFTAQMEDAKGVLAGKVYEDAKQYGMSVKTVKRAAQDMEVVRNPPGGGRTCYWTLSDEMMELFTGGGVNVDTPDATDAPASVDGPSDAEGPVDGEKMTEDDFDKLLGKPPVSAADVEPGGEV